MNSFKVISLGEIKKYAIAHKVISGFAIVVILVGVWLIYSRMTSTSGETRYVLGTAEKGTVVASVSASGQVAASDQVDVKSKSSGEITWVGVKAGDRVYAGQVLASINATDATQAVTNAELDLEQARITLDHDTLLAPIDYEQTKRDVEQAKLDLKNSYADTYASLADSYIKLPDVMSGADTILHGHTISATSQNADAYQNLFIATDSSVQDKVRLFAVHAEDDYQVARTAYDASALAFKSLTRSSDRAALESALVDVKQTATLVAQAVASETNFIDTVVDTLNQRSMTISSSITSAQSTSRGYVSTANSVLSALTSASKSLDNAKKAETDAEHALALASIGNPNGTSPFNVELLKNTVAQKQAALVNAQQALADHSIRAPFAGIVASVVVRRGDTVSNSTVIGTMITNQKIAELSLNEVDAAKIQIGNKVTLTFDAIDSLTLTGSVVEIGAVGAVSQGVVSYALKIGFDGQNSKIKPGMTVNASIITDAHQDVLIVPSSAVKTQGGTSYVQVFSPPLADTGGSQGNPSSIPPALVPVQIGISDDTNTEIISGVNEGEQIVTRVLSGTTAVASTQSAPSIFGAVGGNRSTGGAVRAQIGR